MNGFSLLEIIVTLAILSLLSVMSFNSYQIWYQHETLEKAASELTTALDLAKTLSSITGEKIDLCASMDHLSCNGNWQGDLLIFKTEDDAKIETILQTYSPFPDNISVTFKGLKIPPLYFMNGGETADNGDLSVSSDPGNPHKTLTITISETGIVRANT